MLSESGKRAFLKSHFATAFYLAYKRCDDKKIKGRGCQVAHSLLVNGYMCRHKVTCHNYLENLQVTKLFQVDDASVAEELFQEQSGTSTAGASTNASTNNKQQQQDKSSPDRWADIYEDMPVKRKIALYDYDPRELSPNVDSEVELSFR